MTSFDRFNFKMVGIPDNVGLYGFTTEEYKSQTGEPHPSLNRPELNPLPEVNRLRGAALYTGAVDRLPASDSLRLSEPDKPAQNPAEVFKYSLATSDKFVKKLRGEILQKINTVVADSVEDPNLQRLIYDSLRRVHLACDTVAKFNAMATRVDLKRAGTVRG